MLLPVPYLVGLADVANIRGGSVDLLHLANLSMCGFIPKYHSVALLGQGHLGVSLPTFVLLR